MVHHGEVQDVGTIFLKMKTNFKKDFLKNFVRTFFLIFFLQKFFAGIRVKMAEQQPTYCICNGPDDGRYAASPVLLLLVLFFPSYRC